MSNSLPDNTLVQITRPVVLVVDDDAAVTFVINLHLAELEIEAVIFNETAPALTWLKESSNCLTRAVAMEEKLLQSLPRTIFVDANLKETTGERFSVEARKILGSDTPPLIALSATDRELLIREFPHWNFSYHLKKPFTKLDIANVLESVGVLKNNGLKQSWER